MMDYGENGYLHSKMGAKMTEIKNGDKNARHQIDVRYSLPVLWGIIWSEDVDQWLIGQLLNSFVSLHPVL